MNILFKKITIEKKEYSFLNYLAIAIDSVIPDRSKKFNQTMLSLNDEDKQKMLNEEFWKSQINLLLTHKKSILNAIQKQTDQHILEKYYWLSSCKTLF